MSKKQTKKKRAGYVALLLALVLILVTLVAVIVRCADDLHPDPTPDTPGVELDRQSIVFGGGAAPPADQAKEN